MWCLISVFVFDHGFALGSLQNRARVCRYILQFVKYRTFFLQKIQFSAANFIFFITLGHDAN